MEKEEILKEFRKQCEHDIAEVKKSSNLKSL